MAPLRIVAALAFTLALGACTGTPSPAPSSSPSTAAPSPTGGPLYKASALDLCGSTDLAPLSELGLKVEKRDNTPPTGGTGAACLFTLKSADGRLSSLRVEAVVVSSVDEARRAFQAQQSVTKLKTDREISGLGDQAEGRTLDSEVGFKQSEYLAHMRAGNMTLKAWISVGGNSYTPKDKLSAKAESYLRSTFTSASAAFRQ